MVIDNGLPTAVTANHGGVKPSPSPQDNSTDLLGFMQEVLDQVLPFSLVLGRKFPSITLHPFGASIFQDDPERGKLCYQHLFGLGSVKLDREVSQSLL